jgi:hypothetical protein
MSSPAPPVTPGDDPLALYNSRLHLLEGMPTGVEACHWFKIPSQGPRTPQFYRHTRDQHARGITAETTCTHAAIDHHANGKAYYARCSACCNYIEYFPFDQLEVQMVIAGRRMLSSDLQCDLLTDEERAIVKQACTTLRRPREVAGPRFYAWSVGPRSLRRRAHHRSKAKGPRQEATPSREVTELRTDDTGADVHYICDMCDRGDLYTEERYKQHMHVHRFKEERRWDEGTEISRGAFDVMVSLARDPKASAKTIEILTDFSGLLNLSLPNDLWKPEVSSS